MESTLVESSYPITFRSDDAGRLGEYLKRRESVNLIGMRRVGISNFLRFFLNHKDITKTYINDLNHLFIVVDLNDLIEREIPPFWILTFKRIVDCVEKSNLDEHTKKYVENLFLDNVQSKDLFLTIDAIRKSLLKIIEAGYLPTIFFLRFDRIKDAVTPEFYANLQGLKDATSRELCYVFTSFRSLDILCPKVFMRKSLFYFSQEMYIKPAKKEDIKIIYDTYKKRYKLNLKPAIEQAMFDLVDGYVQYLQLSLILLHECKDQIKDKEALFQNLICDERINLQSEELWESLIEAEQKVLLQFIRKETITEEDKTEGRYLWDTGLISQISNGELKFEVFSQLFNHYLKQKSFDCAQDKQQEGNLADFTKKEHQLFTFLEKNKGQICERESIIEAVWSEEEALGVSDWAIDRLVARVRNKLKKQLSLYEIITIKTRGYKLTSNNN